MRSESDASDAPGGGAWQPPRFPFEPVEITDEGRLGAGEMAGRQEEISHRHDREAALAKRLYLRASELHCLQERDLGGGGGLAPRESPQILSGRLDSCAGNQGGHRGNLLGAEGSIHSAPPTTAKAAGHDVQSARHKRNPRAEGRSAVGAAAYRRGERMHDERSQETFNYLGKKDVIHSELAIPADAPGWVRELHTLHVTEPTLAAEKLWNRVEASEKRKDAQVARHIIMAVPRELTEQQQVDLVTATSGCNMQQVHPRWTDTPPPTEAQEALLQLASKLTKRMQVGFCVRVCVRVCECACVMCVHVHGKRRCV